MADETPRGSPTSTGKGWSKRETDRSKWEAGWRRFCKTYGHNYNQHDICKYCGQVRRL